MGNDVTFQPKTQNLKNGLFVRLIFIIDHFSSPSEVDYRPDGRPILQSM
jgi:hypothetical protein